MTEVTDETLTIVHHDDDRFYELLVDGVPGGLLVYEGAAPRLVFTHAFMYDGFRGRRLIGPFIALTLDDIRSRSETITNFCPVVGHFIETHPAYLDVLNAETPGTW